MKTPVLPFVALTYALLTAPSALAVPSVSYEGVDVTVNYALVGQTASFDYIFAVGNATDAANWIGTTMDALSVQIGAANNGTLLDSISGTLTGQTNVNGTWTGFLDKVSGNGCSVDDADAACYTQLTSGTVDAGVSETVIAADTTYTFNFDVNFKTGVDAANALAGTHSIKFLSLKPNGSGGWSTGLQLSESGYFNPDNPVDPDPGIPEPGTLALFGLGILGLNWSRRRRRQHA